MSYAISAEAAAQGLDRFVEASNSGKKIFYGPLYSAADLRGLAFASDPVGLTLPASTVALFQASLGQAGQGFPRPLRLSETNLDGAPGQLPSGFEYLAAACGVFMPPQLPIHLKDHLTRHSAIRHVRHSNIWNMGASVFWPEGTYGHQSQSVESTLPNTLIQYGVNGTVGSRNFPEGGEMFFPANATIKVELDIFEPVSVTTDGLPWNGGIAGVDPGGNGLSEAEGALVYIVFEGWRFEALTT